jgi:hypothetical protein
LYNGRRDCDDFVVFNTGIQDYLSSNKVRCETLADFIVQRTILPASFSRERIARYRFAKTKNKGDRSLPCWYCMSFCVQDGASTILATPASTYHAASSIPRKRVCLPPVASATSPLYML